MVHPTRAILSLMTVLTPISPLVAGKACLRSNSTDIAPQCKTNATSAGVNSTTALTAAGGRAGNDASSQDHGRGQGNVTIGFHHGNGTHAFGNGTHAFDNGQGQKGRNGSQPLINAISISSIDVFTASPTGISTESAISTQGVTFTSISDSASSFPTDSASSVASDTDTATPTSMAISSSVHSSSASPSATGTSTTSVDGTTFTDKSSPFLFSSQANSLNLIRIATFYGGGGTGACGMPNDDSLSTVALYGVPNGTPLGAYNDGVNCNKTVTITRLDTGVTATAIVTNACPSCGNSSNIDLTTSLFENVLGGTAEMGIMDISWSCPNCVFGSD